MTDGTFDLAVVEGYSYTGGPPYPPAPPVPHYYPALDWARSHGYINRTIFCFGWILGRSQWHPSGWTNQSLRAAVRATKAAYPELAGVAMYGGPPAGAADTATVALIRYASRLMLEEYPDARPPLKQDDGLQTVNNDAEAGCECAPFEMHNAKIRYSGCYRIEVFPDDNEQK